MNFFPSFLKKAISSNKTQSDSNKMQESQKEQERLDRAAAATAGRARDPTTHSPPSATFPGSKPHSKSTSQTAAPPLISSQTTPPIMSRQSPAISKKLSFKSVITESRHEETPVTRLGEIQELHHQRQAEGQHQQQFQGEKKSQPQQSLFGTSVAAVPERSRKMLFPEVPITTTSATKTFNPFPTKKNEEEPLPTPYQELVAGFAPVWTPVDHLSTTEIRAIVEKVVRELLAGIPRDDVRVVGLSLGDVRLIDDELKKLHLRLQKSRRQEEEADEAEYQRQLQQAILLSKEALQREEVQALGEVEGRGAGDLLLLEEEEKQQVPTGAAVVVRKKKSTKKSPRESEEDEGDERRRRREETAEEKKRRKRREKRRRQQQKGKRGQSKDDEKERERDEERDKDPVLRKKQQQQARKHRLEGDSSNDSSIDSSDEAREERRRKRGQRRFSSPRPQPRVNPQQQLGMAQFEEEEIFGEETFYLASAQLPTEALDPMPITRGGDSKVQEILTSKTDQIRMQEEEEEEEEEDEKEGDFRVIQPGVFSGVPQNQYPLDITSVSQFPEVPNLTSAAGRLGPQETQLPLHSQAKIERTNPTLTRAANSNSNRNRRGQQQDATLTRPKTLSFNHLQQRDMSEEERAYKSRGLRLSGGIKTKQKIFASMPLTEEEQQTQRSAAAAARRRRRRPGTGQIELEEEKQNEGEGSHGESTRRTTARSGAFFLSPLAGGPTLSFNAPFYDPTWWPHLQQHHTPPLENLAGFKAFLTFLETKIPTGRNSRIAMDNLLSLLVQTISSGENGEDLIQAFLSISDNPDLNYYVRYLLQASSTSVLQFEPDKLDYHFPTLELLCADPFNDLKHLRFTRLVTCQYYLVNWIFSFFRSLLQYDTYSNKIRFFPNNVAAAAGGNASAAHTVPPREIHEFKKFREQAEVPAENSSGNAPVGMRKRSTARRSRSWAPLPADIPAGSPEALTHIQDFHRAHKLWFDTRTQTWKNDLTGVALDTIVSANDTNFPLDRKNTIFFNLLGEFCQGSSFPPRGSPNTLGEPSFNTWAKKAAIQIGAETDWTQYRPFATATATNPTNEEEEETLATATHLQERMTTRPAYFLKDIKTSLSSNASGVEAAGVATTAQNIEAEAGAEAGAGQEAVGVLMTGYKTRFFLEKSYMSARRTAQNAPIRTHILNVNLNQDWASKAIFQQYDQPWVLRQPSQRSQEVSSIEDIASTFQYNSDYNWNVLHEFIGNEGFFFVNTLLSLENLCEYADQYSLYYGWDALSGDKVMLSYFALAQYARSIALGNLNWERERLQKRYEKYGGITLQNILQQFLPDPYSK